MVENGLKLLLVLSNRRERATGLFATNVVGHDYRLTNKHAAEVLDEAVLQVGDGMVGLLRRWRLFFLFALEEPHRRLAVAGQSILPQLIGEGKDGFADENEGENQNQHDSGSDCADSDSTAYSHVPVCRLDDDSSFQVKMPTVV